MFTHVLPCAREIPQSLLFSVPLWRSGRAPSLDNGTQRLRHRCLVARDAQIRESVKAGALPHPESSVIYLCYLPKHFQSKLNLPRGGGGARNQTCCGRLHRGRRSRRQHMSDEIRSIEIGAVQEVEDL